MKEIHYDNKYDLVPVYGMDVGGYIVLKERTNNIKIGGFMVNLGDEVRDTVSGFSGVAVGEHKYLQGCTRITVQPKVTKDGKLPDTQTFDEPQLVVIKPKTVKQGKRDTGGPMPYKDTRRY